MKTVFVSLPSSDTVQHFVEALTPLEGDFELVSGKYILDARSLMGIFSLDLTQPIQLKIYNDSPKNLRAVQPFITQAKEKPHEQ